MGIAGKMLRQESYLVYYALDLFNPVRLVFKEVEVVKSLGDDIIHRSSLVEGGCRVLENHLDVSYYLTV